MAIKRLLPAFLIILLSASIARSQDEETIKKLFEDAIEAMGGDAFRNVKDMTSDGQSFAFNSEGENSLPIKFVDYTKLPDKSHHETGKGKNDLEMEVFDLGKNAGWIYEAGKGTREAKPDEMKSFRNAVKHSIDFIFRYRYKDPENKLFYLGPGEGQDVTLEMVKLVDTDNDETTIYFDRISKLPAKVDYRDVNKRGIRVHYVDEYSQWHVFQGVNTPLRIDTSLNGRRLQQVFTFMIAYNTNLPDSLFTKPVPPK